MPDRPPKRNASRQTLRQSFFDTAAGRNLKIAFVGGGTWGTATARRVGLNVQDMNARDRAEGKPDIMFQYKGKYPLSSHIYYIMPLPNPLIHSCSPTSPTLFSLSKITYPFGSIRTVR